MAMTITDPGYPPLLGETVHPPVLLFARGRVDLLQSTAFDVMGTRRPTPYGMAAAERLSGDLARAGLTICEWDGARHRYRVAKSALAAEGNTIAVLGCGVDVGTPWRTAIWLDNGRPRG